MHPQRNRDGYMLTTRNRKQVLLSCPIASGNITPSMLLLATSGSGRTCGTVP